jgi:hypothetical protein
MKPMKYVGKDIIGSDVIIPGGTVTLRDPESKLDPLLPPMQTGALLGAMNQVEQSLTETSNASIMSGGNRRTSAYEMSLREQQMEQDLSPYVSELIGASVQMTRLVLGDILQFMTVAEVNHAQGAKAGLRYKNFLVDLKANGSSAKRRHIKFERISPALADKSKALNASYDVLEEQGGMHSDTEIVKADPVSIRNFKYSMVMTEEILKPKSEAVRFKNNLDMLDEIIKTEQVKPGLNNMEEVVKKLLYSTNPVTARNPESFLGQQQGLPPQGGQPQPGAGAPALPPPGSPAAANTAMGQGMPSQGIPQGSPRV